MQRLCDHRLLLRGQEVLPLMQGGMGVDISTAALAHEVCRLGGIGHISDAMVPYLSDKYYGTRYQNEKSKKYAEYRDRQRKEGVFWNPVEVEAAQRRYVSATMEQKQGSGRIFINVMEKVTMGAPKDTLFARLRGAMDGGIDGITLSAGLHLGSLALVADHPRFHDVLFGIIVSSVRALQVFMRSSGKVDRMPDYIVVEGPLAGGHLGFGPDWKEHCLKKITDEVLAFLKENNLKIPVIPAGGIFTGQDAVDYINRGAAGVQVATRFTISQECGLPAHVKHEYLRAREEDVVVNTSSPTGYPMRMLKNSPSLRSNISPNCEALGYILDKNGDCAYHDAYAATPVGPDGKKLPVTDKMCICYHFMKYSCYTCGHNVFRLKDTTHKISDTEWYLPTAEEVFNDYMEK